jgi:hypothetical protein
MTYRDAKTMTARGQVQFRMAKRAAKALGTFQCLIVSADGRRGEMFQLAATDGGWRSRLCVEPDAAVAHADRNLVQLAIVDLEGQDARAYRPLLGRLAQAGGPLLIVCGNEGDIEEEMWVRQLGAWLYLPGVAHSCNVALLCGEARHIAEKLAQASEVRGGVAAVGG